MTTVLIFQRLRPGCGRGGNKTYVNVAVEARELVSDYASKSPWNDPARNSFAITVSQGVYDAVRSGAQPLFHDNKANLPLWQNETAGTGEPLVTGSFVDPEDDQSVFTADVSIPDDRLIVRLYDADPSTTGNHVASMDLDEGQDAGETTVFLKLFDADDVASTTNGQNQKTDIAGKRMIFDFTNGVTTFGVKTDVPGTVSFRSTGQFRVIGPGDENGVVFVVYGRSISPPRV
jgi:hypothetical protein